MQQPTMVEAVPEGPIKQWWLVNPTEEDMLIGTPTRAYLEGHNKVPVRSPNPKDSRCMQEAAGEGRCMSVCMTRNDVKTLNSIRLVQVCLTL